MYIKLTSIIYGSGYCQRERMKGNEITSKSPGTTFPNGNESKQPETQSTVGKQSEARVGKCVSAPWQRIEFLPAQGG